MTEMIEKGSMQVSIKKSLYDRLTAKKKVFFPTLPKDAISYSMVIEELLKIAEEAH